MYCNVFHSSIYFLWYLCRAWSFLADKPSSAIFIWIPFNFATSSFENFESKSNSAQKSRSSRSGVKQVADVYQSAINRWCSVISNAANSPLKWLNPPDCWQDTSYFQTVWSAFSANLENLEDFQDSDSFRSLQEATIKRASLSSHIRFRIASITPNLLIERLKF